MIGKTEMWKAIVRSAEVSDAFERTKQYFESYAEAHKQFGAICIGLDLDSRITVISGEPDKLKIKTPETALPKVDHAYVPKDDK